MNNYLAQTGTFSKSPAAYGFEPDLTVVRTSKSKIKLSDGQWYIDWPGGLGSNLLGYATPKFNERIAWSMSRVAGSQTFPSQLEYTVAEWLCEMLGAHVPGWKAEAVSTRFAKTGSDVTTMAIRLARAVTGKKHILCFKGHYHGWHDWTVSRTPPAHGIVSDHYIFETEFNQAGLDKIKSNDIAAVIFEQGIVDPPKNWYNQLRKFCDKAGALLIADEIVTGLRYGLGGACERYDIKPDLVCMGKAMGNGLPISALTGWRDLMDWFSRNDPVFCSSTVWGETVGLAAAEFVLSKWSDDNVAYLWGVGADLIKKSAWPIVGHPCRSLFEFKNNDERAYFIHGLRKRGIIANRPNFPSLSHTYEDVKDTTTAIAEIKFEFDKLSPAQLKKAVKGKEAAVLFSTR